MNPWVLTPWLVGIALSLALGISPVVAAGKAVPMKMTFRDGNLAAEIVAAPLREVMAEISRLTGAEIRWLGQYGDERASFKFTGVPLHQALERILKQNFMLSYAPSGTLTDIWILSRGNGEQPAAGLQTAAAVDRLIAVDEGRAGIDIAKQPLAVRIEAVELLAMRAEKDEAAREILSHVASTDRHPRVREIASLALLGLQ